MVFGVQSFNLYSLWLALLVLSLAMFPDNWYPSRSQARALDL